MELIITTLKQTNPRVITMATNWRRKEINIVLGLRDEMIANNIDNTLIETYLKDEYERINIHYNNKIKKFYDKNSNKTDNKSRKNAITFLIKNKECLEENGASPMFIANYVKKYYDIICDKYDNNTNMKYTNDDVDFIDM